MNDFTDISVNHNFLHILNPKALGILALNADILVPKVV